MGGEKPFKSMRITLSDDAVVMLESLKKSGQFRSDSATIEEVIRMLHELVTEHTPFLCRIRKGDLENDSDLRNKLADFGDTTVKRLSRFVGLQKSEQEG